MVHRPGRSRDHRAPRAKGSCLTCGYCLSAVVGLAVAGAWTEVGPEGQSRDEFLAALHEARPHGAPEADWRALVGGVAESLDAARVSTIPQHHAAMIRRSLERLAAEPLRSPEALAFQVQFVRWALPRFLVSPPTEAATQKLLAQVRDLAEWMGAQLQAAGLQEPEPIVAGWREDVLVLASTFLTGSAMHPLAEPDLAAVQSRFEEKLNDPSRGDAHNQESVAIRAAAAALAVMEEKACRPPAQPLPRGLTQLLDARVEADRREAEKERQRDIQEFHAVSLERELRAARQDMDAWALVLDALVLSDVLTRGGRPPGGGASSPDGSWSWAVMVTGLDKGGGLLRVGKDENGALKLRTPTDPTMAQSRWERWRWTNGEVAIVGDELRFRHPKMEREAHQALQLVVEGAGITHFTHEEWAQMLAAQAAGSKVLWGAVARYLVAGEAGAGPDEAGTVQLRCGVGVSPFCAVPLVHRIERVGPDGRLVLLGAEGESVGSVTVKPGLGKTGKSRVPRQIVIELEPRVVQVWATMLVTHGVGEEPTEEVWRSPLPARVRRIVFELDASTPGLVLVREARAYDERGKEVCRAVVEAFSLVEPNGGMVP